MIDRMFRLAVVALSLIAAPCFAGDVDDAELERKLEEARERLEEASREVAELSARLGANAVEFVRHFNVDGRRAMIGINMDKPKDGRDGVLIAGVTPGGPADQAGLRAGDLIVSLNGTILTADDDNSPQHKVLEIMREVDAGDEITLEYERDGQKSVANVVTDEMSPQAFGFAFSEEDMEDLMADLEDLPAIANFPNLHDFSSRWGDMEMVELTGELGQYFGTDKGILIVRAPENEDIPLEDGDVILRIDGRTPTSPGHALRILHSYQGGEHLSIEIVRKQRPMTVEVDLPERNGDLRESSLPRPFNVLVPAPAIQT